MKILVCVKQVPDTGVTFQLDSSAPRLEIPQHAEFRMNRFDEFAVEEAVRIKEIRPGTHIDILSVGPNRSVASIRRAIGMGADRGIHLATANESYISPFTIASWIATYARPQNYDLILTGIMSEDGMHGQVGPMVAEILGLPCATAAIHVQLSPEAETILTKREIEGGCKGLLELTLPAVLTIQSGINKPRYPSLSNILRANQQQLETIAAGTLEQPPLRERVVRSGPPQKSREGRLLRGTAQQKAEQLLDILSEKGTIR